MNHREGFTYQRVAGSGDTICGLQVEAYGTTQITFDSPDVHGGVRTLTLLDVALVPGHSTSTVSLLRLNRGGVHWSSEFPSILSAKKTTFGSLHRVENHWVLQKDLIFEPAVARIPICPSCAEDGSNWDEVDKYLGISSSKSS